MGVRLSHSTSNDITFLFALVPQGTLQSIDGQALDNQFVLATHALTVATAAASGPCNVQLFSLNGQYRFTVSFLFFP